MKDDPKTPLRGEAAWRATKDAVAKRNAAARERFAGERAGHEAMRAEGRRQAMRAQPRPSPRGD